ncbi:MULTISPECIES: acyl-CoA thioesterase [Marinobacter]|jgi:acyl-CoA thioester hydrolase|uniref:Thioesterase superfamily protein n=1 Tax=Marinobacter manganoxydans MnI7-9 TaxID=1094979 RepID=G6YTS6_9GAMM|nr:MULTISPECIES: acyl-CoA thioesterase [Marinobacter]MCP4061848.1 acyl-CoA thioesterase [Gammaproteobacteria bacterium]HAS76508.1 acyl-CoA thioesterase [Marinobacter adhaerens]EHJ04415.1 thioesterase superfamily protein [Marinobacter manganoxydans MnI7-9]MAK50753.1 thioesterase [Marinobacter sp.]MAM51033.1 thioesterase [Marinobacter sp.]|tara:strand:- start:1022 stop:1483 length:462 start_codon:yes stop_codon:yes gene_type:complete
MQQHDIDWDLPAPFTIEIAVRPEDTDRLGHANNVVYVRWLEDVSWAHIESLGMTWELHEKTGKAMAITRTEIDYLASANAGDQLVLGTWLTDYDGRFRSARQFQLVRPSDGRTLVRAVSTHACVDLKSQRPARAPKEFAEILGSAVVAGGKGL